MYTHTCRNSSSSRRFTCICFFVLLWCFGFLGGLLSAWHSAEAFSSLFHMAAGQCVSIVGALVVTVLPFFLALFAIRISDHLLLFVCFLKSFLLGFSLFATLLIFQSAGWLVCLLLLFSDICIAPLFCWFVLHHFLERDHTVGFALLIFILLLALIACVDCCLISPFLAMLIN